MTDTTTKQRNDAVLDCAAYRDFHDAMRGAGLSLRERRAWRIDDQHGTSGPNLALLDVYHVATGAFSESLLVWFGGADGYEVARVMPTQTTRERVAMLRDRARVAVASARPVALPGV